MTNENSIIELSGGEAIFNILKYIEHKGNKYEPIDLKSVLTDIDNAIDKDSEVRLITTSTNSFTFIFLIREAIGFLKNSLQWRALVCCSNPSYKQEAISVLRYIRDKYVVSFFPEMDSYIVDWFEEAGYFNFGDPLGENRVIMRSQVDDLLSFFKSAPVSQQPRPKPRREKSKSGRTRKHKR